MTPPKILIPLPSEGTGTERLVWNGPWGQSSIVISVEEFDRTVAAMIAVQEARRKS